MPYIVTTRKPYPYKAANAVPPDATIDTRTAVATLDDARGHARVSLGGALGWQVVEHRTAIDELPESGGTIGPLPDGSMIEVRPVDGMTLRGLVQAPAVWTLDETLAAFNADA